MCGEKLCLLAVRLPQLVLIKRSNYSCLFQAGHDKFYASPIAFIYAPLLCKQTIAQAWQKGKVAAGIFNENSPEISVFRCFLIGVEIVKLKRGKETVLRLHDFFHEEEGVKYL